MNIRVLKKQELLPALHLVWEVFVEEVAPLYSSQGVETFQKFIKYEQMAPLYGNGEIIFFGAFEGENLQGVMAVREKGHICLFYVKKECQGQGIGRQLFQAVRDYCTRVLRVNKITVHAAIKAVAKYERLGFLATAQEQIVEGMRYVPMELSVEGKNNRNRTPLIIAVVIGGILSLLSLIVLFFAVGVAGRYVQEKTYQEAVPFNDYENPFSGDLFGDEEIIPDDTLDEEESGIDQIDAYKADDLSYEIEEKEYTFSDMENKTTTVDFKVAYPEIAGIDKNVQDRVNKALKECAMETVERIYKQPSQEIKERVLQADTPVLISYVTYKITYMDESFLSVVFEDNSYEGSTIDYDISLRTRNISLKDGTVYETRDVVKMDTAFLSVLRAELESEADNTQFLKELTEDDLKKTLEGDSLGGVYVTNFFVDKEGIQIGYNLNYPKEDANDLGFAWVTAPFELKEVEQYKTDSSIWSYIAP